MAALGALGIAAVACGPEQTGSPGGGAGTAHAGGTGPTGDAGTGGTVQTCGAGPTGGTGGDGGSLAEGCVDIRVSPELLENPTQWSIAGLPLSVWGTSKGIHVAWGASKYIDSVQSMYVLRIDTFDPQSGKPLVERVYKLFDKPNSGNIRAVAGSPDGHIAVIYDTGLSLAVGHLDDPALSIVTPLKKSGDPWNPQFVGWDGEAFALDGGFDDSYVGRFDTAGNQILPFTKYGAISGSYDAFGPKLSTHPGSGRTYYFGATGEAYLAGHQRDGTPLPGTGGGWKVLKLIGTDSKGGLFQSITAGPDGAWAIWDVDDPAIVTRTFAQRLNLDGDPVGKAAELFVPLDIDPGIFRVHTSMPRPNGAAWFAAATGRYIWQFEYDGETMSEPQVLLDHGACLPEDLGVRDMYAFEHDGNTWVTFSEQGYFVRRVLLVKPGCRYESGWRLAHEKGT